jgi:predicted O-methyltransferase YrrM
MGIATKIGRNINFLKELWTKRISVRTLVGSDNYVFLSSYPPGHFYSPVPDLPETRKKANEIFDRSVKYLPEVQINEAGQLKLLGQFAEYYDSMPFSDHANDGCRYYLDNPYFSYGDGIVLHSILRNFKPRKVIEIGSGFSSAEMLDLNDRFFDGKIEFTFIEPYPQRLLSLLSKGDLSHCRIIAKPLQAVEMSLFATLEANDFLFIDSSHVGKINSDVLQILFNILPLLKPGVIIHFHDILWPFEYPQNWVEEGRAWNEAYFLRAFLQYNSAFEIVFFNSFMALQHRKEIEDWIPKVLRSPSTKETVGNSSLWLRKVA